MLTPVTVNNGSVYVPNDWNLVVLDASMETPRWEAEYRYCGPFTPADGALYGRTSQGNHGFKTFAIRAQ